MESTSSMFRTGTIAAAAVLSLTLAGCLEKEPPYEITGSASGTYLLNKETGEVKLIVGARLFPVAEPSSQADAVGMAKTWPPQTPSGVPGVTVILRTKYRDGEMIYEAEASPYIGVLETTRGSMGRIGAAFTLHLYDADAFQVGDKTDLILREATPVVDEKGTPALLQWTGSIPMSESTYNAVTGIGVGWRGFPEPEAAN